MQDLASTMQRNYRTPIKQPPTKSNSHEPPYTQSETVPKPKTYHMELQRVRQDILMHKREDSDIEGLKRILNEDYVLNEESITTEVHVFPDYLKLVPIILVDIGTLASHLYEKGYEVEARKLDRQYSSVIGQSAISISQRY